jgi:hypothetical protein
MFGRKFAILALVAMSAATIAQAAPITSFNNIDFDSGGVTAPGPYKGFDAPNAPEIVGWTNYRNGAAGPLNDAGVEGPAAWWIDDDTLYNQAAFMSSGDAAYTMSTYTIQAGDVFGISYLAGEWGWTGSNGEWTATLFYDNPANVIGSYVQNINTWFPDDVLYSSTTGIAATPASVGGTLGILMKSTGTRIVQVDEIVVDVVNVVPEPASLLLALGSLACLAIGRNR